MAKKSQKNSKHIADLINSATLPSLLLLAQVDKFAFLGALDASKSEPLAREGLPSKPRWCTTLPTTKCTCFRPRRVRPSASPTSRPFSATFRSLLAILLSGITLREWPKVRKGADSTPQKSTAYARTNQAVVHGHRQGTETAPSRRVENAGIPPIGTADPGQDMGVTAVAFGLSVGVLLR